MSTESTERRFFRSTLASYASLGTRLVITFATRMILARLILPEGHGLYELALRTVIVASAVRDLGLPFHLMRDPRKPYGTVLAFSLVQGVLVTGALLLLAPLFGVLNPDLPQVLRVLSVWVLLDAVVAVPKTFFDRELRIGRLVAPEIWRSLTVAAVSLGLAWLGWGVWAFVAGDLVASALFAALVWWRAAGEIPLEVRPSLLPGLIRGSSWLFLIWIVLQVLTYVDLYIVEVFGSTAMVGQYARAYMIAFLVPQIVVPRALLPALVEYRYDPERFFTAFRLGTVLLMSCQVVAGYALFFAADQVVAILLGEDWGPAVGLLRVLCFVPFIAVFDDLGGEVLKVRREDRLWLVVVTLNLASLVGAGLWLTHRFGAVGMAWANFALVGNLLLAWRVAELFRGRFRRLVGDLVYVYLVPLPLFLAAGWVSPRESWWRLAATAGAALLGGGLLARRFYRPFRDFFFAGSSADGGDGRERP